MRRFYTFSQGKMSTVSYLEQFRNLVEVISTIEGSIGVAPGLLKMVAKEKKKTIEELTDDNKSKAQERYLAVAFIMGCNHGRFSKFIEDIENDFLQKRNNYPDTIAGAYNFLINCKQDPRNLVCSVGVSNDGVSFTNVDGPPDDDDDANNDPEVIMNNNGNTGKQNRTKDKSKYTCHCCGQKGHYPSKWDNERIALCQSNNPNDGASTTSSLTSTEPSGQSRQTGATMLLAGIVEGEFDEDLTIGFQFLTQGQEETVLQSSNSLAVPEYWYSWITSPLLMCFRMQSSCATSTKLLRNIRKADSFIDIHCNTGIASTNLIGDLPGYGRVWYIQWELQIFYSLHVCKNMDM
jgi:hypothetical protein